MSIVAFFMLATELYFKVSALLLLVSTLINAFQLVSYVLVLISDPGTPKKSLHPDKSPAAK